MFQVKMENSYIQVKYFIILLSIIIKPWSFKFADLPSTPFIQKPLTTKGVIENV